MVQAGAAKTQVQQASIDRAKPFLISAIQKGNEKMLKKILDAHFPIEEHINNMTVLMFSSAYGSPAILQELINRSADISAQDMAGRNVCHIVCAAGKLENFQFLLNVITQNNQQAMLNQPTNGGITPLMLAVQSMNGPLVTACVAAGMNQALVDYVGRTAMDYATEMGN